MKKLFYFCSLMLSLIVQAQEVVTTVENRKTGEQIKVHCSNEKCDQVQFRYIDENAQETVLADFTQEQYAQKVKEIIEKDKIEFFNHFFVGSHMIVTELPWDNGEFVLFYFFMWPISIPLTAVVVGVDVVVLPISMISISGDAINGNAGKKLARKVEQKKNLKLSSRRFNILIERL